MSVDEYMKLPNQRYCQFIGQCNFDGKPIDDLIAEFKRSLLTDIELEFHLRCVDVSHSSIEDEVDSVMEVISKLIALYDKYKSDDTPILHKSEFEQIWIPSDENDWQKAIVSKNKLLHFRPCNIFFKDPSKWMYKSRKFSGFAIEFND